MNLEEARNNIGAEVELDESTKPYSAMYATIEKFDSEVVGILEKSSIIKICNIDETRNQCVISVSEYGVETAVLFMLPHHLKLKPQNYKIHVPTEEESKEAQELFFELGYEWADGLKSIQYSNFPYLYAFIKSKTLKCDQERHKEGFIKFDARQITLQDLRDMVAKKKGEDKKMEIEMTWQDALDAFKEGKEVEVKNISWFNIKDLKLENVKRGTAFRVVPKRIILNGEYTKEELLQKIGEME